jgi:hypothetical protein
MSGTTISSQTTIGVDLTSASQSPLVITGSGGIAVSSGYAIYGNDAATWMIVNAGVVSSTDPNDSAIYLLGDTILTNAATGTIEGGRAAMLLHGSTSTVVNYGTVGSPSGYLGIYVYGGGVVTNVGSGRIEANGQGVTFRFSTGTVINSGLIDASHGFAGVRLADGGVVTNAATGTITGNSGIIVGDTAGAVTNAGFITGAGYGVYLAVGGTVTNTAGTIAGYDGIVARGAALDMTNQGSIGGTYIGIYLAAGGTVTDAGAISGNGAAVDFDGSVGGVLNIDPGATFSGAVDGNASSTLNLAAGGTTGTIYGLGSQYTGFGIVNVDAGASWQLTGNNDLGEGSTLTN